MGALRRGEGFHGREKGKNIPVAATSLVQRAKGHRRHAQKMLSGHLAAHRRIPSLPALGVGPRPTFLTIPDPRGRSLEKSACPPKPWGLCLGARWLRVRRAAWRVRGRADAGACPRWERAVFPAIVSGDGRAWVMRAASANRVPGGSFFRGTKQGSGGPAAGQVHSSAQRGPGLWWSVLGPRRERGAPEGRWRREVAGQGPQEALACSGVELAALNQRGSFIRQVARGGCAFGCRQVQGLGPACLFPPRVRSE